jgi:hypothetical protein
MPPIVLDGIGGRRAFPRASSREIDLPGVLTRELFALRGRNDF